MNLATLAEQHEHYVGVRMRLIGAPAAAPTVKLEHDEPRPKPLPFQPCHIGVLIATGEAHFAWEYDDSTRVPTLREVLLAVAEKHRVSIDEIRSKVRERKVVHARHEAAYWMRKKTHASLQMIARALGGVDHTSVIYAYRQHEARMSKGEE